METETDINEALSSVGYKGKFSQENIIEEAIDGGPKNESFRELVTWICYEIHVIRNTDEKVGKDTGFNDFMLELSAFLKELGCPYEDCVSGPISGRLQTKKSRFLLLDFLLTELMASKMYNFNFPKEEKLLIPISQSSTADSLQTITKVLNLGKPPDNIAPRVLFDKIANKMDETIKKTNPKIISKPLLQLKQDLTDAQWGYLTNLQKELDKEYDLRRQMLLTRLDVTVQSFQWSEKMKNRQNEVETRYKTKYKDLEGLKKGGIDTDIAALLASRADLAIIEKTSSANVRQNTASKIQKHVIGKVPDRGGRAYEHAPPPPEMPSWQQNRSSGPVGGSGGGGSAGPRGGGVNRGGFQSGGRGGASSHGNWSQQQYDQRSQTSQGYSQYNQPQYTQRQENQWQGSSGGGQSRIQGGWSARGSDKQYSQRDSSGYYGGSGGGIGGGDRSSNSGGYHNQQVQNYYGQNQGYSGAGSYNKDRNYGNDRGTMSYGSSDRGSSGYGSERGSIIGYGNDRGSGNYDRGGYGGSDRNNTPRGKSNYNRGGRR